MPNSPFINTLLASPITGDEIERRSFEIIDGLVAPGARSDGEQELARRLVHAGGDPALAGALQIRNKAVEAGIRALCRGAPLVVDARMIRAGLSLGRLRRAWRGYRRGDITCHLLDADVAEQARSTGLPRSLYALRKARPRLDGAIAVFGNSPVALLELNRLVIEEGIRPALVVGFPVGFVHVQEAKEELGRLDLPALILSGNRGGSPLAVAAIHALCELSARQPVSIEGDTDAIGRGPVAGSGRVADRPDAVILLGHGSRVPGAGDALDRVVGALRARLEPTRVERCYMSRLGPHFPDTFEKIVAAGARSVVVIPYFLFTGLHIQLDIPEMLQQCAQNFPDVRVAYGEPLGFHDSLVDVVEERIEAARGAIDVREMALPPREKFPIPPGQLEFVGMPPEMASRWNRQVTEPTADNESRHER